MTALSLDAEGTSLGNDVHSTEIKQAMNFIIKCRCSSVVEHVIGNDGVVSPILISGTINKKASLRGAFLLMHIGDRKRTYDMIA